MSSLLVLQLINRFMGSPVFIFQIFLKFKKTTTITTFDVRPNLTLNGIYKVSFKLKTLSTLCKIENTKPEAQAMYASRRPSTTQQLRHLLRLNGSHNIDASLLSPGTQIFENSLKQSSRTFYKTIQFRNVKEFQ